MSNNLSDRTEKEKLEEEMIRRLAEQERAKTVKLRDQAEEITNPKRRLAKTILALLNKL